MKVPFVDLKAQYADIKDEINPAIQDVLDNTAFVMGKAVSDFEESFASFCNSKYAVGLSSGTSALQLGLKAMGIGKGAEVITVPNSFIATTEAITSVGASFKFVDVDAKTYNIDISKIKEAITEKTKAIMPVHLYGQPVDMDPIMEIAEEKDLIVIEDACQAHGAEYKGNRVPVSSAACFSFYPGKNLGAYGDGGCLVTDDEEVMKKAAMLRNHGREAGHKYDSTIEGENARLDALQARILSVKLKHLNDWNDSRRKNAKIYDDLLEGVVTPFVPEFAKPVYHLYVIQHEKRDELQKFLKENEISSGVHYPMPLHEQPAYSHMGFNKDDFPVTSAHAGKILSLPMFAELSEEQIHFVADKVKEFSRG